MDLAFEAPRRTLWAHAEKVDAVVSHWLKDPQVGRNLVLDQTLPSAVAEFAPLPPSLAPALKAALAFMAALFSPSPEFGSPL
jgi:hypothetical protein